MSQEWGERQQTKKGGSGQPVLFLLFPLVDGAREKGVACGEERERRCGALKAKVYRTLSVSEGQL